MNAYPAGRYCFDGLYWHCGGEPVGDQALDEGMEVESTLMLDNSKSRDGLSTLRLLVSNLAAGLSRPAYL